MTVLSWSFSQAVSAKDDIFGDALPELAISRLGSTRLRHRSAVYSLSFSANGKYILSSGGERKWYDNCVLWDASTGRKIRAFRNDGGVEFVTLSADGSLAAGVTKDKILLWKTSTGELTREIRGSKWKWAAFTNDDKRLVAIGAIGETVIDVETGRTIWKTRGDRKGYPYCATLLPNVNRLVTCKYDGAVRVVELASGRQVLQTHVLGRVHSIAASPDERMLAIGGTHRDIIVLDANTGERIFRLRTNDENACVAFSPDGKLLASGGRKGSIKIWEVATRRLVRTLIGSFGDVRAIAFSKTGESFAAAGDDGLIRIWDVANWQERPELPRHATIAPCSVTFSSCGKRVATLGGEGVARLWNTTTGRQIAAYTFDGDPSLGKLLCGRFERGSKALIIAGQLYLNNDLVFFVNVREFEKPRVGLTRTAPIPICIFSAISPDGNSVAIQTTGGVTVRDRRTLKERFQIHKQYGWLAFSPDGKRLVTSDRKGVISISDATNGRPLIRLQTGVSRLGPMALGPKNKWLAFARASSLQIWDLNRRVSVHQVRLTWSKGIYTVTFSPDGRYVATGHIEGVVCIWKVATGNKVAKLTGHRAKILDLTFSPNGKYLASASVDGTALIWDVKSAVHVRAQ